MKGADTNRHPASGRRRTERPRLRSALSFLFYAALVLALSLVLSWPLWKLAVVNKAAFTTAAGLALAAGLIGLAVRAGLRARKARGQGTRRRRARRGAA